MKKFWKIAVVLIALAVTTATAGSQFTPTKVLEPGKKYTVVPLTSFGSMSELTRTLLEVGMKFSPDPAKENDPRTKVCGEYFAVVGEPGYPAVKYGGVLFLANDQGDYKVIVANSNTLTPKVGKHKTPEAVGTPAIKNDVSSQFSWEIRLSQEEFNLAKKCLVP